jgi:hypothetical protein
MSNTPEYSLDIQHSELGLALTGEMASNYQKAMFAIAKNPGLTNLGVSKVINRPQGSMGAPCRAARDTLCLSDSRGGGLVHIVDHARYTAACEALGVTPAVGAAFAKVHDGPPVARNVPIRLFTTPVATGTGTGRLLVTDEGTSAKDDPMLEVRTAVEHTRKLMRMLDIQHISITLDDAKITREVRTMTTIHL